jgi:hypothetical protein
MVIGTVAGLMLAGYGIWMLVSGHAPGPTARAFRTVRDAGFYHLLFGVALGLVVVGTGLDRGLLTLLITVPAIVLAGVAVVRFRPRGRRPVGGK